MFGDANLARELGNEQESTQIFREVAPMFEALGDPYWLAEALLNRGCLEALLGDLDTGRNQIDRAIAMAREQHDDFLLGNALSNLGWLELQAGLMSEAAGHLEEALGAWERAGNLWGIALAQNNLGCALVALGDVDRAEELLRSSIPASARLRMPWLVCVSLDELGISVALARGDDRRAARLLGARDRLAAELGMAPTWFTSDDTVNEHPRVPGRRRLRDRLRRGPRHEPRPDRRLRRRRRSRSDRVIRARWRELMMKSRRGAAYP